MSSAKWRPFCLGFNMLNLKYTPDLHTATEIGSNEAKMENNVSSSKNCYSNPLEVNRHVIFPLSFACDAEYYMTQPLMPYR